MQEIIDLINSKKTSEKIPPESFIKIQQEPGSILFVDGGNAELATTPEFSIHFVRVAGILFNGKEKTKTDISEFYAYFHLERVGEKLVIKTKILPVRGSNIADENQFVFYLMNQEFSSFANAVRRAAEINLACNLAKRLGKNSIIVLDGSLETKSDIEKSAMEKLRSFAKENGTHLCALSKTTAIVSYSGESLPFLVNKCAPDDRCCLPVSDSGIFQTFFLKLHPNSGYIFRCDILPETSKDIFGALAFVSNDPVFLGYPYGLIEADKIARVSNREREILRMEFAAKLGKNWLDLEDKEKAVNAHEILDNIL